PGAASVIVGQTVQLMATLKDARGNVPTDRTVTWSSGDTAVATVNSVGLVTAKGAGSVTIAAASGAQSGAATVTVTEPNQLTAAFTFDCSGLDCAFRNLSTGPGRFTSFRWDFGDGSNSTTTDATYMGHRYPASGTYTVRLTAL